jgi:hypothetical protein
VKSNESEGGALAVTVRTSRRLIPIAGAIAIGLAAVVIAVGLEQHDQPLATTSPSPTRSTSLPGASDSAGVYNDDFGFVVIDSPHSYLDAVGTIAAIRKESRDARIAVTPINSQNLAVSPEGNRVAYRRLGVPAELRVLTTVGGTEESIVTLPSDQHGGGVAWSSDGLGLLYSTETGSFDAGDAAGAATLNVYEFAANGRRGTTIDTQINTGWRYRPVAWDRSANLASAGLTGDGASMSFYVSVATDLTKPPARQQVDARSGSGVGLAMGSIRSSSDAKFVLGVDAVSGNIKWWPLGNYAANKSQPGAGKRGAIWRPGTHEIGFLSEDRFWLGDVDKAGAQGLCCAVFDAAPAASTLRTFRADGSAVVLAFPQGVGPDAIAYALIRLGGDATSRSGDRVIFTVDRAGVAVSVRLR